MFIVYGEMKINGRWRPFTKKVDAPDDKMAREKAFSLLGSHHRLQRTEISIRSVEKVSEKEVKK